LIPTPKICSQNFARKTKFPIDTISWDFEVVPHITDDAPKSEDGTYIRGLYIEGARFDSDAILMAESRPKELFTSMPPIWLKPAANRKKPTEGIYECPCYKTLTRAGKDTFIAIIYVLLICEQELCQPLVIPQTSY
jgi:dynein heavy chain, axonemal